MLAMRSTKASKPPFSGRTISDVIEDLARPIASESILDAEYREMNLDAIRERDASEWIEG